MARGELRNPDVRWGDTQIWYGPGNTADEIEHVTVVRPYHGDEWEVVEYTFVGGYEMYEEGVREWISQSAVVEAKSAKKAFRKGVDYISEYGGDEWEGTTDDLIEESVLPPRGQTYEQWKKSLRKNPGSAKFPEMSDKDWMKLDASQELGRIMDSLGGTGGRVEVTENTQRIALNRLASLRKKVASLRDADLNQRIESTERLAQLPNGALNLHFEMTRAKGQKLRVTKTNQSDAEALVQSGFAQYTETSSGTRYIKPAWVSNPDTRKLKNKLLE